MTKYIELIDKYEIRQSDSDEYNPPSYIWRDNTGELIRCKDCKHASVGRNEVDSWQWCKVHCCDFEMNDYCSWAERKEDGKNTDSDDQS